MLNSAHEEKAFYKAVGSNIRRLREQVRGLSQEKLAKSVGLERTSITNIENGRQKLLLHTASAIAARLGVSVNDLLPVPAETVEIDQSLFPGDVDPEDRAAIEAAIRG